jgi:hypothetical protein
MLWVVVHLGCIEVDHGLDGGDVEAPGGHVGGNEHVVRAGLELLEHAHAGRLVLVAVQRHHCTSGEAGECGARAGGGHRQGTKERHV